jgi:DNA primase small subunit
MPHSITPESTPTDEQTAVKPEQSTQDIAMDDAPSPVEAETDDNAKVNLEELFDDDGSDGEFASSAPVKSEEEASQPAATLYAC